MYFKFQEEDKLTGKYLATPTYAFTGSNFVPDTFMSSAFGPITSGTVDAATPELIFRSSSAWQAPYILQDATAPASFANEVIQYNALGFSASATAFVPTNSILSSYSTSSIGYYVSSSVFFFSASVHELTSSHGGPGCTPLRVINNALFETYGLYDSAIKQRYNDTLIFYHNAFHGQFYDTGDHRFENYTSPGLQIDNVIFETGSSVTMEARYWLSPDTPGLNTLLVLSATPIPLMMGYKLYVGASQQFYFQIKESDASTTSFTSEFTASLNSWNHIVARYDSTTGTGSFVHNLSSSTFTTNPLIESEGFGNAIADIGSAFGGTQFWQGGLHEARIWKDYRSDVEISGTWNRSLTSNEMLDDNLYGYWPLHHGTGSKAVDYGPYKNDLPSRGDLDPQFRMWGISTDTNFKFCETDINQADECYILDISNIFYGDSIRPRSFEFFESSYASASTTVGLGINDQIIAYDTTKFLDDGDGCLILSGGHIWNKLGKIFYEHGIVVFTNPQTLDFGIQAAAGVNTQSTSSFNFDAQHSVYENMYICALPAGSVNSTTNPTYVKDINTLAGMPVHPCPTALPTGSYYQQRVTTKDVYITGICLYNEYYELVGVAKVSQPIRATDERDLMFKLNFDS